MAVMKDPAQRAARREQKRRLILRFLRTEIFSTPWVLSELIQTTDPRTIKRTVDALEREGLVVVDTVETDWRRVSLVGITPHGQAAAWRPDSGEALVEKSYERGRVGLTVLDHTLDLQLLRIRLARVGWRDWTNADRIAPAARANVNVRRQNYKRPDALARHPSRGVLAVECERHVKTRKRYEMIVGSHLSSIKTGAFSGVVWACPTTEIAQTVRQIIGGIGYAVVQGERIKLGPADREKLHVADYQSIVSL